MKNQALFSLEDKSKKSKCHLLQFLFGALRVKDFDSKADRQSSLKVAPVAQWFKCWPAKLQF